MGKSDKKNQALGDDPLAWLNAGASANKKDEKKKTVPNKSSGKKKKPAKSSPKKEKKEKKAAAVTDAANTSNQLVLESSLVINKAADFYETLKKVDTAGQAVEIDASKVEIIDSAILQILFAFALNLKENNIKLTWKKPTENLLNKTSILGLKEQLGL